MSLRWDAPETPDAEAAEAAEEAEEAAAPQNERETDVFLTGFDVGWAAARRRYGPEGAATAERLAHEFERGVAVGAALHRYYAQQTDAEREAEAAGPAPVGAQAADLKGLRPLPPEPGAER